MSTANPPVPTKRRRGKRPDAWSIGGWIFLALLLIFSAVPMIWMFLTSIKTQFAALEYPPQWFPKDPTLESYRRLLSPRQDFGRDFLRWLGNSVWVATATTVLGVVIAVPAAYAFSRFHFAGRGGLFYAVLLRNMFPAVVFLMPLFIVMRTLDLVNTHWSLILTYLTFGLPLSIWLLKGFYDNIPIELEQAARIDGASRFQAFLRIIMPLSAPGLIATAIYSFIVAWNEYLYAYTFLNSRELLTSPVGLQQFSTEFVTNWPGLMAAAFIMSVPVVVLFLVLQKHFVKALTESAVKS